MRSTVMTIIAAVGATLCCTGPVLFSSIGATSLAGFTIFEPLRPYLSLAAVGLLGTAFWRSYRPATAEACCSIEEQSKLISQRRTLWIVSGLVGIFLAFPYFTASTVFAQSNNLQEQQQMTNPLSTWTVSGMTCSGCALGLEASLKREQGMELCEVRYSDAKMDCRIDGVNIKTADVPDLLARYGYKASLIVNQQAESL